ncbi:MAG: MerR family transcriptional regulator [Planctomyces sp.]|nr:MerR family transcriptional regulator [Planctomyces sp.]
MTHREAFRLVDQFGGRAIQSVSSATTMLVIGEEGWPLEADGATSQKLRQSLQLLADGSEIRVVAESDWLHLLGLNERREEIQKAYTPAMLSRLLDIPVRLIRRWARLGLIRPVRRVCRLPYFDYREVASARRLASLLDQGVSPQTIEKSLAELGQTLAGTDRSLAQLTILVQDENVLLRDAYGVIHPQTGQRLLDFDGAASPLSVVNPPADVNPDGEQMDRIHGKGEMELNSTAIQSSETDSDEGPISISITEARLQQGDRRMKDWNADEWFHEGCRLAEESEFESAVNAFRNSMSLLVSEQFLLREDEFGGPAERAVFPDPAEVNFHLADSLYRIGRRDAAIERYHSAIEFAPDFIEAWTQLGCLQSEAGLLDAAEESLVTAISIHRANPDALLHYAQLLEQMERLDEAGTYWQQYLQHDSRGPWAEHARIRLEQIQQGVPARPALH